MEECAQLCLYSACLSFDAGNPSLFQAGDCFLSYDTRDTLRASDVQEVSQLDLYERKGGQPVVDSAYAKSAGCYFKTGGSEGGAYTVRMEGLGGRG